MQEKLIVSIASEQFNAALKIAEQYKQIELRLDKLSLSNNQILEIVNAADLVVLTGILNNPEQLDITGLTNIINEKSHKIIIDMPHDKLHIFDKFSFTSNINVTKIISYHNWNICDNSVIELFEKFTADIKNIITQSNILVKFAVQINTTQQLQELWDIFIIYPHLKDKLILIPLGEKYKSERITSLKLGSKYMFCYVTSPTATGQLNYAEYC